jgi:hypothetical protein
MISRRFTIGWLCGIAWAALAASAALADTPAAAGQQIRFKKTQLDDRFRSEGVVVADFNRDGLLDIAAGSVWYAAPDWKMHPIGAQPQEFDPHRYSDSFCNFADDLNGDGWPDLIVVGFPGKETWWFENPGESGGPWRRHLITPVTNNESPTYVDLDGDGRRELVMGISPNPAQPDSDERFMAYLKPAAEPTAPWRIFRISEAAAPGTRRYAHGLGVGDVNGDGRLDVIVPQGWWEAPADRAAGVWKFHSAKLGGDCAQMYVCDFDGDGHNDVASSSAHAIGVWWHQQTPQGWVTHEIDRSFSQSHSLVMADINSDGLPDLVTGKRWWAHGPRGDVGADQPPVLYWFELRREGNQPTWIPHQIDADSGVGTQFEVVDVNGDGLLDIVTSNKRGVFLFEQVRQ